MTTCTCREHFSREVFQCQGSQKLFPREGLSLPIPSEELSRVSSQGGWPVEQLLPSERWKPAQQWSCSPCFFSSSLLMISSSFFMDACNFVNDSCKAFIFFWSSWKASSILHSITCLVFSFFLLSVGKDWCQWEADIACLKGRPPIQLRMIKSSVLKSLLEGLFLGIPTGWILVFSPAGCPGLCWEKPTAGTSLHPEILGSRASAWAWAI